MKPKATVCGIGINDATYTVRPKKGVVCPFYRAWTGMLNRCYSKPTHLLQPYYIGDSVCEEWLTFSNFKSWMEQQDWEGNSLVKSVVSSDNKVYSPSNCACVPNAVSTLLDGVKEEVSRGVIGAYPNGFGKYRSSVRSMNGTKYLGTFNTEHAAHRAWQKAKINIISNYAENISDVRVKNTLLSKRNKLQYDLLNDLETTTFEENNMNTQLQLSAETSVQTMGSLEISKLLKKRHDTVKVSIERLSLDQHISLPPLTEVAFENELGHTRTTTEYRLGKRDSYIVVAQLSPEFTAQLVDRWQELEDQAKSPQIALPNFNDPVLAARAWADAVESKNKAVALTYQQSALILEQEDEIKIMKPAVQWVETYVESKAMIYKFRQVTQLLGAKERDFRAWLVACKIMYKLSGYWTCYAEHRDAGMFETYVDKHNTYKTETYFTAKGFEWISKKWDKHVASQSI